MEITEFHCLVKKNTILDKNTGVVINFGHNVCRIKKILKLNNFYLIEHSWRMFKLFCYDSLGNFVKTIEPPSEIFLPVYNTVNGFLIIGICKYLHVYDDKLQLCEQILLEDNIFATIKHNEKLYMMYRNLHPNTVFELTYDSGFSVKPITDANIIIHKSLFVIKITIDTIEYSISSADEHRVQCHNIFSSDKYVFTTDDGLYCNSKLIIPPAENGSYVKYFTVNQLSIKN